MSSSNTASAAAAIVDEPLRPSGNETATKSSTLTSTHIASPEPPTPREQHVVASFSKREATASDFKLVVNAIGEMGLDWNEIARLQPLDPEFRRLRQDSRSGLKLLSTCIGAQNLIVDISNGPARPYIPFSCRRRVFDVFHGLGHPGVERTRQAISAKVVWPSMKQDVSKWARECLQCQQAKVIKHTTPPIGDFAVPNRRFQHLNIDLVTLPESNGFNYLFTAVDRFSRWPVAVPLVDMTTESVMDAFAYGWVQTYGVPATITTDRGSQFTSCLFEQLTKTWGIKHLTTTAYHPQANGLVERFHRRLKEALIALGAESPHNWFWRLPCVLLSIRTTLKPDLGASPADLVFGEQLAVPGESLPSNPVDDEQLLRQRASALADIRVEVARLQPVPTSAHRQPLVHIPQELSSCTHVFVRRGGVQSTLSSPYVGPFRVVSRTDMNFVIAVPGRQNETVAITRVKPCYSSFDDAQDAEPTMPRIGRPPQPQPQPRRNRRRRQRRRSDDDDEMLESPQENPPQPPPQWSPPPPPSPPHPTPSPPRRVTPDWQVSDDKYFGDADPPPPVSPQPHRPQMDWFSPQPSPPPLPPPPSSTAARSTAARRRRDG